MTEREEPLGGGLTKPVRAGDTVRRATGPWTPAVHALLRHLEAVGFEGAPRVLGVDERGREVLTYVDCEVGWRPYPEGNFGDKALAAAARLVRRLVHALGELEAVAPGSATPPIEGPSDATETDATVQDTHVASVLRAHARAVRGMGRRAEAGRTGKRARAGAGCRGAAGRDGAATGTRGVVGRRAAGGARAGITGQ